MKRTLAVIGAGGWGSNWTQRSLRDTEWETLAYVDADPAVLERLRKAGIPDDRLFTDPVAAMDSARTDAVTCTVPNPGRVPILERALMEGRHILVDKPLVHTADALRRLLEMGAARRSVLMVAQNYRFFAGTQFAKRSIDEGRIGPVGSMHVHFLRHCPQVATKFMKDLPGVVAMGLEMCIHHFDMMRFLLREEPQTISAQGWRSRWSAGVGYDSLDVHLDFPGGIRVAYDAAWGATHNGTDWPGHWEILGERGTISLGQQNRAFSLYDAEEAVVTADAGPPGESDTVQSMDRVWAEFKTAVSASEGAGSGAGTGFCPLEDNAKSLGVALAVSESVETGRPVDYSTFMRANGLS